MIFKEVSARDIRFEKIQIGPVYNIPAARPAFSYRGIAGVPPPTEQSTIQQRAPLVEAIYTKLTQPGINAFVLTGIGGVGKSTLAALLCRYVQAQLSTGKGFFQTPPLWLSIDQAATVADVIGTMFQRLDTPLSVLDNLSPAGQVEALFTLLDTLALPRLIVLDQFDNLLDWATGSALPTQLGVGELLDALNSRPWSSSCRVLLTSRPFPKGTHEAPPTCLHAYPIDGLTQQEGLALFRSRGIQAPEADMNKALTFCDGHPLSLVLLMTLIQLYGIPLGDLLAEPTLWIEDITRNLLDAVFRRLTEEQRTVLHAMSVYRTAVPVAAITPFLPQSSSQQISVSLRSLLVQQLIQPAGNGSYQVHAVVARYVQTHFVEGDQRANQQALHAAHARAAHYYLDQAQASALPREQRRRLNDIQGIIEAVWQYTQAAQWQDAYALMEQEDLLSDLSLWGGNIQLLDLCQWFLPQREWQPEPGQAITIYLYLGGASSLLGKKQQALEYYQQALAISREVGNRKDEGTTLNNIGAVYDDLGNKQQALEYYQQALTISREVKDRRDESGTLNNIGWVYDHLGNKRQALEYYQQALAIWREVGDRGGEGSSLNNIGRVYYALGNKQQALEYCRQALAIWREVGDRRGEGIALSSIGAVYDALGNEQQALEYYQQALALSREVGDRQVEGTTLNNIGAVYDDLGNKQQALEYYQQALTISREVGDRGGEGSTFNNIGLVYDALGDKQQALEYYQQALTLLQEVGDRRGESTTLSSIGAVYDALGNKQQALEYYQQALALLQEVGDRGGEGTILNNIGGVYDALGNKQQALEYYQQALTLSREVKDRGGEGTTLSSIGGIYDALGNKQQALEYYQQALALSREVGDRQVEGTRLNNMGGVYYALGNEQQALEYYQQALALHQEVGDHKGEGGTLSNIGLVYDALGDKQQALEYYQQALALSREVGDRKGEGVTLNNIGKVYNDQGDKQQALEYYQQALSIRREVGDREGEGATLNNIGAIYDGLGDKQQALEYYQQALALSREVGNHEGEGVTQWNIATLALGQHHYDFALAAFLLARQCFEKTSSPRQKEVESWIDDLRRKIGKKRFDALQARIEPQSQQIFEQALSDRQAQHKEEE